MKYKKIELPYGYEALEPYVDALTVETHYTKHHAGYEAKFNEGAIGTELEKFNTIEEVMINYPNISDNLKPLVRNAGGGLINHNFYFMQFTRTRSEEELALINSTFGSLEEFRKEIIAKGLAVFGSGWVWAVIKEGKLEIITTPNQENPWMANITNVVIGIDLWEHSYYLKYKQDRKTYIENTLDLLFK